MENLVETTAFGNVRLVAHHTIELQSPIGDDEEIKDAISHGTTVLIDSLKEQKRQLDQQELDFFVMKKRKELVEATRK